MPQDGGVGCCRRGRGEGRAACGDGGHVMRPHTVPLFQGFEKFSYTVDCPVQLVQSRKINQCLAFVGQGELVTSTQAATLLVAITLAVVLSVAVGFVEKRMHEE